VVYGASGSVGHVIAKYLAEQPSLASLRWAVAGRPDSSVPTSPSSKVSASSPASPTKKPGGKTPPPLLRRTTSSLMQEISDSPAFASRPSIIFADATDDASMRAMARRTTVLITTVGPYTTYGESAVRACADAGTHYVDITGEAFWVSAMRDKYGTRAAETGACLVSFAGYDCVPFELSTYLAHRALVAHGTTLVTAECLTAYHGAGSAPRGTLLTVVGMPAAGLELPRGWLKYVTPTERFAFVRDLACWALPLWSTQAGAFTLPEPMGAVMTTIVHRSAPALGYANLSFSSRFDMSASARANLGSAVASVLDLICLFGVLPALGYVCACAVLAPVAVGIGAPLLLLPPTRRLILRLITDYLAYPGDPLSRVSVRTRGKGADGRTTDVLLEIPGDPGVYCTALCMAETALAVLDAAKSGGPRTLPKGFTTPAEACGDALAARLQKAKGCVLRVDGRA